LVERWAPENAKAVSTRRKKRAGFEKKMLTGFGGSDIKVGRCDVAGRDRGSSFWLRKKVLTGEGG
jgi:hypothetical protein